MQTVQLSKEQTVATDEQTDKLITGLYGPRGGAAFQSAQSNFRQRVAKHGLPPEVRGLVQVCCSAASPCNHQKVSPNTICDACKAAQPVYATVDDILATHAQFGQFDRVAVKNLMGPNWPPHWDRVPDGVGIFSDKPAVDPHDLAQQFHETYERLAPLFNYETRKESAKPWADVPAKNKALMVSVCREVLLRISMSVVNYRG